MRITRIDIGDMDRRITFYRRDDSYRDPDTNQVVGVDVPICSRWARIQPLVGYELEQAMQIAADLTHKVTIWKTDGITPNDWFIYKGQRYDIRSIIDVDTAREINVIYATLRAS